MKKGSNWALHFYLAFLQTAGTSLRRFAFFLLKIKTPAATLLIGALLF
jgi:hypothetical protein